MKENNNKASYFFILAGIPFIGVGSLGRALSSGLRFATQEDMIFLVLAVHVISFSLSFLIGAWLISKLAPAFKSNHDFGNTLKLIITSYIPFLISLLIASAFPGVSFISFIGLTFTVFLFALGTGIMLATPSAKRTGFIIVSFLILFGGNYLINLLFELLFLPQPKI